MGLDVYLYKCSNRAEADELEAQYQEKERAIWNADGKRFNDLTEAQRATRYQKCAKAALALGLDRDGRYPGREEVDQPSALYPDHLFHLGYFRSSYNGGGIDSVMHRAGLSGLANIFDAKRGDYHIVPDWAASLARVDAAIAALDAYAQSDAGQFDISEESAGGYGEMPSGADQAKALFMEQLNDHKDTPDDWRAYSSQQGTFHLDGREVYAIMPGVNCINHPCVYVAYRIPGDYWQWYRQALEIVKETIQHVLAQPDADLYYLVWSG